MSLNPDRMAAPSPDTAAASRVGPRGRAAEAPPGVPQANARAALLLPPDATGEHLEAYPRILRDVFTRDSDLALRLERASLALGDLHDALTSADPNEANPIVQHDLAAVADFKVLMECLLDDAKAMGARIP